MLSAARAAPGNERARATRATTLRRPAARGLRTFGVTGRYLLLRSGIRILLPLPVFHRSVVSRFVYLQWDVYCTFVPSLSDDEGLLCAPFRSQGNGRAVTATGSISVAPRRCLSSLSA